MKSKQKRSPILFVVLVLITQLAFVTPAAAQNANSSTTVVEQETPNTRPCRNRCFQNYRRCRRLTNENPPRLQACRVRLRRCLRYCG